MESAVSKVANFEKSIWNSIKSFAHYCFQSVLYFGKSVGEGIMNSDKNVIKGCKTYIGGVVKIVKEVATLVASKSIDFVLRNFNLFLNKTKLIVSEFITAILSMSYSSRIY